MLRRASRLLAPILSDLEHGRTPTHRAVQRAHAYCRAAWSADDEAGDDGSSSGEFPIRLADVAFAPPSGAPPTKGPPRVQRTLGRHLHARERERFMETLVEVGDDHELARGHSVAGHCSGDWLHARLSDPRETMRSAEWVVSARLRFGGLQDHVITREIGRAHV